MNNRIGESASQLWRATCGVAMGISMAGGIAGCSGIFGSAQNRPQQLNPSNFYSPAPAASGNSSAQTSTPLGPDYSNGPSVAIHPGAIGNALVNGGAPATPPTPPSRVPEVSKQDVKQDSKLEQSVQPQATTASLSTGPATPRTSATGGAVGVSTGQYFIVGGVIAEVNGQPLYANKVLTLIEKPLKAKAKTLPPDQFQMLAADLINKQVNELVHDELEFAAADRYLEDSDRNLATALTMKWRDDQIVASGGSIELARKHSAVDDQDFDEQVRQQYRTELVQIYYQKKVFPKIQVSAEDIRHYYTQNLDKLFTQHDQARFRVIKVGVSQTGSRELALKKALSIHDRAVAGEDFGTIASKDNDDPLWKSSHGLIAGEKEMIQRGAFRWEKVEQAVWLTGEGHITDVVDDGNAFFIAKVEKLDRGTVKPFETDVVQEQIRAELRSAQFRALREHVQESLFKGATVTLTPSTMNIALDIAMQKYVTWAVH